MKIENITHAVALSDFEAKYHKLAMHYREDNVVFVKIVYQGHPSYAIMCKDFNVLLNELIQDCKYILTNVYTKETEKWTSVMKTEMTLSEKPNKHYYYQGVVLTDHYFAPDSVVEVEILPTIVALEDDIECETENEDRYVYYTNKGIHCNIDHKFCGEASIIFPDANKGFTDYKCYVLPYKAYVDMSNKQYIDMGMCPREYTNLYITRAIICEYGNSILGKDTCSYLMLDTIDNVIEIERQHEDSVVNHGMYEMSKNIYEVINDEYVFIIASKDELPSHVPIMAIYWDEGIIGMK